MKSPEILIIADDLTGAADAAAAVAAKGLRVLIPFEWLSSEAVDCLVLTTDSRDLDRDSATGRVRELVSGLQNSGILPGSRIVYKKIDSTLRGHPGSELSALMESSGLDSALIAPAFPAQGRTTVGGCQYVYGVRLDRTGFAKDAGECDLRRLCGHISEAVLTVDLGRVRSLEAGLEGALAGPSSVLVIADAETDADLRRLAVWGLSAGLRLFCGSAGLMAALVDVGVQSRQSGSPTRPEHRSGPVLVVAGSRHPQTRAQVQRLGEGGSVVFQVPGPDEMTLGMRDLEERARKLLLEGNDVVFSAGGGGDEAPNCPDVVLFLGELVRRIVPGIPLGGLVMTGGDTARAVCGALGVVAIRVLGEVLPGIPCGELRGGLCPSLPVVTKAGGFGQAESLEQVLRFLREEDGSARA